MNSAGYPPNILALSCVLNQAAVGSQSHREASVAELELLELREELLEELIEELLPDSEDSEE